MQERYSVNIMVFGGLCLIILLLSGCGTQLTAKGNSDPLEMNFWAPNLLYLNSSKCQRLYVEIDTVQGSEPDTETIESLREFLTQYCDKPSGIKIIKDSVIPPDDVSLTRPELLALRYMGGPDDVMPDSTAYLYILFYDSTQLAARKNKAFINPYVRILPYPSAIYIDMGYINKQHMGVLSEHQTQLLTHEAGHILGLNWSQQKDSVWHCSNKTCLMYERYEVELIPGFMPQKTRKKTFCDSCKDYLNKDGLRQSEKNLRFLGPVMVRSEKQYHVLSLPGFVKLYFGSLNSIQWQDVLAEARIETPRRAAKADTVAVVMGTDQSSDRYNPPDLRQIISFAQNDPSRTVRLGVNMIQQGLNKKHTQISRSPKNTSDWIKQW